jgi:hypothetical protein
MSAPTPGLPNAYPLVGPVVINEIMYHPVSGGDEFVELQNPTGDDVPLYAPAHPANTWRFLDGIDYAFPSGVVLPAGGYLLVVPTEPDAFRAKHGVDASVPIYGPYGGVLDNGGESLRLYKPGDPEPDGFVPYIMADRVRYDDKAPWPLRPDGLGHSLSRIVALDYGNDPVNWATSTFGGTPGAPNEMIDDSPPTTPGGLTGTPLSPTRIDLAWTAASDPQSGVAVYRVYRDGMQIGSPAGTSFSDTTVGIGTPYVYEVAAVNADGFESERSAPFPITLAGIEAAIAADETTVRVQFTEPLDPASAGAAGSYAIGGVTILDAALEPDGVTVALTTSPLTSGETYTLTVVGVTAASGNPVAPGVQATFRAGRENGLYAEYYNNKDLTGLALVRTDAVVDFDWGSGSPDPVIGSDTFSVRWTGFVVPLYTETYTFWTVSDDGIRLWVDGQLLINNWTDHGPTEDSHSIDLVAGQAVDIRMEYYENGGGAVAKLRWSSLSQEKEAIPAAQLSSDPLPGISVGDAEVVEGDDGTTALAFTVTVSGDPGAPVVVDYATEAGSATGDDYDDVTGTLTFAPGESRTQVVTVPVHGDTTIEPTEGLSLVLCGARSGTIARDTGAGTIRNDDIAAPGTLDVDTDAMVGGELNPDGPGAHSLGIRGLDANGNLATTLFALRSDGGWLRISGDSAYADAADPEWHTIDEWSGLRLRGLTPDTSYTFEATARDDDGNESGIVDVGTYDTAREGDLNGDDTLTGLDFVHVRAAVRGDAVAGPDMLWCADLNDDGTVDGSDLLLVIEDIRGL